MWFEGSDTAPGVFMTYPTATAEPNRTRLTYESIHAPRVAYPRNLMEVEGEVQVLYLSPVAKIASSTRREAFMPNPSIEGTCNIRLRRLSPAPHVKR